MNPIVVFDLQERYALTSRDYQRVWRDFPVSIENVLKARRAV